MPYDAEGNWIPAPPPQWGVQSVDAYGGDYGQWAQAALAANQVYNPEFRQYDYGPLGQGADLNTLLWGNSGQKPFQDFGMGILGQIGQSAGLDAGFDWNPYLTRAAYDTNFAPSLSDTGAGMWGTAGGTDFRNINPVDYINKALGYAAQDNPALSGYSSSLAPGTDLWNQGNVMQNDWSRIQADRSTDAFNSGLLSVLGVIGAGALAPAAAGGEYASAMGPTGASAAAPAYEGLGGLVSGGGAFTGAGATGTIAAGAAPVSGATPQAVTTPVPPASTPLPPLEATAGVAGLPPLEATAGVAGGAAAAGTLAPGEQGGIPTTGGNTLSGQTVNDLLNNWFGGQQQPRQPGAFPLTDLAGTLLGMYGNQQTGNQAKDLLQMHINSDLWRPQQQRYFEPLYQAATQGIGNTAYGQSILESVARTNAAKGYNQSGNMMHDLAKGLNTATMDYVKGVSPLAMGHGGVRDLNSAASGALIQQPGSQAASMGTLLGILTGQGGQNNNTQNIWQGLQTIFGA